ncbi:MAG: hypothetical protein KZQ64_16185 [gamma proteobacterium symbiont of Bathyaustriella thionipta]|nr:hypothetical protein [gamma proteobacterium symbiont of Bathyaustriella thionipta]MCU7949320.1 hypothetical protein [gamma proteobacterium symbiont of Bathyaustriella thionipta]MCU7954906.1 hypothetical protein [gamma proteobacterium symbiont of Bathyaustriella thionipta]MCU7955909.1 hypothetical protein [gamma proteobacterium symbiont of Bathyaustriella thionipta]MCU7968201.1 hypothetical protein [gamma proteobacterium symbiont of Bathyaustriella thionipta]
MLSQNHKSIIVTLTSVVIGITTLGGVVNAQQGVVNAQQNVVNAPQTVVNTQPNNFNMQDYQFPPANAVPQIKTQSASAVSQMAKPVTNKQPRRLAQAYPMPYPAQARPAPRPAPYGAPRPPAYGSAPYGGPGARPMPAPFPAPMRSGPGTPPPYGMPYNNRPPAYGNPYSNGPYNRGPYNPYNRGPYNNNNGPFGNSPFKNFGGGPFNSNSAPWETWPFGARDSFWSRKEFPFNEQNPTDWFQPGDPKEGMAVMWDDLIAAPDDLGTMPGGWNVPSISVPNPVDLEDQLEEASKEIPDLIRIYND